MTWTEYQRLHHLYVNSPGLVFRVEPWLRCRPAAYVDYISITPSQGPLEEVYFRCDLLDSNFTTSQQLFKAEIEIGDILQVADEDMLVVDKPSVLGDQGVLVQRAYAGTSIPSAGHYFGTPIWVWKNFSDHISSDKGIASVSALRRGFERAHDHFGTHSATVRAINAGRRFWDTVQPPTGFETYRHTWIRFYLKTLAGHRIADHRALSTMLIKDIETDDSAFATLRLEGLGSLVRIAAEASGTRACREWLVHDPTFGVVGNLLSQVQEFRGVGSDPVWGIPPHWQRALAARSSRTISLPSATYAISTHGRPEEWHKGELADWDTDPDPTVEASVDWLLRNCFTPQIPCTAICWDPQATGAGKVMTGDPSTVGRIYFAMGYEEIHEFDPITRESKRVVFSIPNITSGVVRMLKYNPLDGSDPGTPKILGVAVKHVQPPPVTNTAFTNRTPNMCLFQWNGPNVGFSSTKAITNGWPGFHFWRHGRDVANLSVAGQPAATCKVVGPVPAIPPQAVEGIRVPISHYVYGESNAVYPNAGFPAIYSTIGLGLVDRAKYDGRLRDGILLQTGAQAERTFGGNNAAVYERVADYTVVKYNSTTGMNLKFTYGQQGAFDTCGDYNSGNSIMAVGAIIYCEMTNATTGEISMKMWSPNTGIITNIKTFNTAPGEEQPCCVTGRYIDTSSVEGQLFCFVGWMQWKETNVVSASFIKGYRINSVTETPAEQAVYDSTTDTLSAFYTPLWMCALDRNTATNDPHLIVTWFKRDHNIDYSAGGDGTGYTKKYAYRAYNAFPFTDAVPASNSFKSDSCVHAITAVPGVARTAFAVDSAGRLVKLVTNDTTAVVSVTPIDTGEPPVSGEPWSATKDLAVAGENKCFGISSPTWIPHEDTRGPASNDTRQFGGFYILWKLDDNLWDTIEYAYYKDKTIEEALGDVAFATNAVWGFDNNGRGDFNMFDRFPSGSPIITLDSADRTTRMKKRRGYMEIENQCEVTPWFPKIGSVHIDVALNRRYPNKGPIAPEVRTTNLKQQTVVLTCLKGGKVNQAQFSAYVKGGVIKAFLVESHAAGSSDGKPLLAPAYREANHGYSSLYHETIGVTPGARIRFPDGQLLAISSDNHEGWEQGTMGVDVDGAWTPQADFPAGSPVEIDLRMETAGRSITTTAPDGSYVLTSSYEWQEVGLGQDWATGVMVRFPEPDDDGQNIDRNEVAWEQGEIITITVDGVTVEKDENSKVTSFDATSVAKYGKRTLATARGVLSPRRGLFVADVRVAAGGRPRWLWSVDTRLLPFIQIGHVLTLKNPKLIPTSPFTEDVIVREVEHSPRSKRSLLECIGAPHD